ncbi:unnamed protein product [Triticum turgidum subsp. durum]|uniref:Auxin-responsive protein n=1 Tax=Triticum turgidum subsp. durum TaxID=4567 RepID=A0A9R0XFA6_TRITD|nr:unnamed protein product [Triticum turgidum subsp. durum]
MHRSHGLVPCQLLSMASTVHRQDVLPLAYKFSKRLSSTPSLLHPLIHQLSSATSIKLQRVEALGRKRLTVSAKEDQDCYSSVPAKGHCVMYMVDGTRFEVPLEYLSTTVFGELLRMSQEEFGFASDGKITLPCDAAVMEYAIEMTRRNASIEVESALLSSMVTSCHYTGCAMPTVGASQQICCL